MIQEACGDVVQLRRAFERVLLTRRACLIQEVREIERELGIKRPAAFDESTKLQGPQETGSLTP